MYFWRTSSFAAISCFIIKKTYFDGCDYKKSFQISPNSSSFKKKCFAKSLDIDTNPLHEKKINLKQCLYISDDDSFKCNNDEWLRSIGKSFQWNYNWFDQTKKSEGNKFLIFVSAAEANLGNSKKLSKLGKRQTRCAAKRINEILTSEMNCNDCRAFMLYSDSPLTEEMVKEQPAYFNNAYKSQNLSEANPGAYLPFKRGENFIKQNFMDKRYLEESFREHFFTPACSDTKEIKVFLTHPNIIRYLLMKVLQFPMNAWKRFQVSPGSITIVNVYYTGAVSVSQIGAHFFQNTYDNKYLGNVYEN